MVNWGRSRLESLVRVGQTPRSGKPRESRGGRVRFRWPRSEPRTVPVRSGRVERQPQCEELFLEEFDKRFDESVHRLSLSSRPERIAQLASRCLGRFCLPVLSAPARLGVPSVAMRVMPGEPAGTTLAPASTRGIGRPDPSNFDEQS